MGKGFDSQQQKPYKNVNKIISGYHRWHDDNNEKYLA